MKTPSLRLADSLRLLIEALLEARSELFGKLFRVVFGANQRRAPVPLSQGLWTCVGVAEIPPDFLPRLERRLTLSRFTSLTLGLALRSYFKRRLAGFSASPRVARPSLQAEKLP